ncbi:MAG: YicC family protein [Treponema sp.]|nr:YicC family protein [Treponema sp.]
MTSMTGYAYTEKNYDKAAVSVEIKSVNSRFLDLSINLPSFLNPLESWFRGMISEKVTRGKVDVYIKVRELQSSNVVVPDVNAAVSYYEAIKKVSEACGYEKEIPLSMIVSQPGVLNITSSYDIELYKEMLLPVFNESLSKYVADCEREGENLAKDLLIKLSKLDECAEAFAKWQPEMENHFKEMILSKFNELLADKVDMNRVMTETAALVVKYTINEEIVRLKSHLSAMKEEMMNNPFPGKKLDFLCQEINREINTIGSKNQSAEIGAVVITAKDSIENIREQAKNLA